MGTKKISELDEITELNDNDLILVVDVTNEVTKKMKASKIKLKDTGWIPATIISSNWSNYSWEPLSYRVIENVCYIHGAGTLSNISASSFNEVIFTLPYVPKQNIQFICARNNSSHFANMMVRYGGTSANLEFVTTDDSATSIDVFVNISYPI